MEKAPLISVVVPVYNAAERLPACLDSVRGQTFRDFECILVDDGSPDDSGALCDQFAAGFAAARVIHKANGGVSSARNAGLQAARGRYVLFLDADDELASRALEYAARVQAEAPDALVWWEYTRDPALFARQNDAPLQWERTSRAAQEPASDYTLVFVAVWNKLFPLDTLRRHGLSFDCSIGYAGATGEDRKFMAEFLERVYPGENFPLAHIQNPLYHYYNNPVSMTATPQTGSDEPDPPEPDYCARLRAEYEEKLRAAPDLLAGEPFAAACTVRIYLRSLAFGMWSADRLGEPLARRDWDTPVTRTMLDFCRRQRVFVPYYLPFRLGSAAFIRRFYDWDIRRSAWFFRFRLLFKLLLPGWQEPPAFKE